jgi:hypothetical protein
MKQMAIKFPAQPPASACLESMMAAIENGFYALEKVAALFVTPLD